MKTLLLVCAVAVSACTPSDPQPSFQSIDVRVRMETDIRSRSMIWSSPSGPSERPAIRYERVRARWGHTVFGYQPSIELDITALSSHPYVAPRVEVELTCDGISDSKPAFFMDLSRAQAGDTLHDTAKLFHAYDRVPDACDLVLSYPGGRPGPMRFCVRGTLATPGECP